ncbi:MAG TPA: dipeptide epimerase [Nitrospira sp.]|jgi:o-succinylbenzoate synthase|nr:dipeptide epimerase [Nitrospira sp.]
MNGRTRVIERIDCWPMDIPLTDPFVVATGSRTLAETLFIRLTLADGTRGYGESAPFPEVGGETRAASLAAVDRLGRTMLGYPADQFKDIARQLRDEAPDEPAARCALETALLDAYSREHNLPLWAVWGAADVRERETDITLPIETPDKTLALARGWYAKGFRLFKMKIGKDVDGDVHRLEAVQREFPDVAFIGDANQGFTREECLAFAKGVSAFRDRIVLLEQPLVREDLEGLAEIRRKTGIAVAADESVRSLADARQVAAQNAADYINIKIMKTGVLAAHEIASFTLASGLKLMVGGMVETRIAMGCSFSLALGMKGFEVIDLDTPLLLDHDPVKGGYQYSGSRLLPWQDAGLGMTVHPPDRMLTLCL